MFYEGYVASLISKDYTQQAERQATMNWRSRHLKSREAKVALAALTSLLGLFIR
jgi:hypothetical protein